LGPCPEGASSRVVRRRRRNTRYAHLRHVAGDRRRDGRLGGRGARRGGARVASPTPRTLGPLGIPMVFLLRRSLKIDAVALGVLLGLVAVVAASVLAYGEAESHRVTSSPKPTGPYAVGRASYHWTVRSREETFTKKEGNKRELIAFVWYPAEKPAAVRIPPRTCPASGARSGRRSLAPSPSRPSASGRCAPTPSRTTGSGG
jgi:hypothetical protein